MNASELLERVASLVNTDRVFAPAEKTGTKTIIPAMSVRVAGARAGHRHETDDGEGGAYAITARPMGALVISGDTVRWKTPFDLNKVILGGQLVGIAYFVSAWLIERSTAKAAVKVAQVTARAAVQ